MKPHHVLIVDDEEFVRDSLEEILRAKGLATSAAGNKLVASSATK